MNIFIGALFVTIVVLLGVIAKLRSDLCYARWIIERLAFVSLTQGHTDVEFWQVSDPADVAAFIQGEITLRELFRHLEHK